MKVIVVSDVHGSFEGLKRAADRADLLIVLGDLLEYVDYAEPNRGVLGALFGADEVSRLAAFRAAGRFGEFHSHQTLLWNNLDDAPGAIAEAVAQQYRDAVAAIGSDALITLGNVDVPDVWDRIAPAPLRHLDGVAVEVGGLRLGFVAGGCLKHPASDGPWQYYDRDRTTYAARLAELGTVDIICTHVPPDLDDLRYDVHAGRTEMYGYGLRELIERDGPVLSLFGHVHRPRASEIPLGSTRCVNVGFFKPKGACFEFDLDSLR